MEKDKDLYKPLPNNECIKLTIEKSKVAWFRFIYTIVCTKGS